MIEPRIKILPEDLVNKIAAGEVVERPASVVKELLENSIDAGAAQIVIEVQDAGKKLIRIADNGCGMTEEELKLALERHSTSKISSLQDLFNIKTLGFRGEALPSIASVSHLRIEKNPAGAGLTVEVSDLFYNTPARKKFLKANATETGQIGGIIAKYALAYPQIALKFINEGKTLIATTGNKSLKDAVLAVYGLELARNLVEVEYPFASGKIFGLVSPPTLTRVDKNYETFFVNRRYIKNFLLNRALEEAYRTLIPGNRYPAAVLFVEIDPAQVDVNVHPAKREVKFMKTQEVLAAVTAAVKTALAAVISASPNLNAHADMGQGKEWRPEMMGSFFPENIFQPALAETMAELEVTAVLPLVPIYQFKNTYIVATDGEELVLIDQHAAHERIIFDQLNSQTPAAGRQSLLIPESIEFTAVEAAVIQENLEYLNSLGFEIAVFGSQTFILRAVPAAAARISARQFLSDIVADLQNIGKSAQLAVKQENIRKLIACHSAIKAGDKLAAAEINRLIKDLYTTQNPLTCPHGRPTMVRLAEDEIKKRFGR